MIFRLAKSEPSDRVDHIKVIEPGSDDDDGHRDDDQPVNQPRCYPGRGLEAARALVVVELGQVLQRVVELAGDLAGGVEVSESSGKILPPLKSLRGQRAAIKFR